MRVASSHLPLPLSSFIGRERELEDVRHWLSESRLVTLTGTGGCGKTRLAIRVSAEVSDWFEGGVCWIELAALADESLVPQVVANALDLREVTQQALCEALTNFLRAKHLLLVLDNCEHLIAACAWLVEYLLRTCPHLKILVTSREPLALGGETVYPVPPLSLPQAQEASPLQLLQSEAVCLFVERARAVKPDLVLSEQNAPAVAQICRRLDGIPLAIELAAARVKLLTVEHIAARLDDRFSLLTTGSRTALPRQQTLRATMDWSYDLLAEDSRLLFLRLSVFVGGFTLEAAEAICGAAPLTAAEVLDLLARLVDQSLVNVDQQEQPERYRMLETVREYAWEKLAESGEGERVRNRHLACFLGLAEEAEPHLEGSEQVGWLDRLERDHDNLRAAFDYAWQTDMTSALTLAGALWWFWYVRGHVCEGLERLRKLLSHPQAAERTLARAKALNGAGLLQWFQGSLVEARTLLEEALEIGRELEAQSNLARTLLFLGVVTYRQQDYAMARSLLEEGLAICRELGAAGKRDAAWFLAFLGDLNSYEHDCLRAEAFYAESVELLREVGDLELLALPLRHWGYLALHEGNDEQASARFRESLRLNLAAREMHGIAASLVGLGALAAKRGQAMRAARLFGVVEAIVDTIATALLDADCLEFERHVAAINAEVDGATLAKAWREGQAMTFEQAMGYALDMSAASEEIALPVPPPTRRQAARQQFGGLTERERQVAALIPHGTSNREIAGQLVVTERTVEKHVENIMSKLGFNSRAQIAAWAVESGLVQDHG